MNLTAPTKRWIIASGIFLFLWITNPSIKAFKDHEGTSGYQYLRRDINFLIGSVYEYRGEKYIGFMENFLDITYHPVVKVIEKKPKREASQPIKNNDPFAEFGGHEIKK